MLLAVGASAGRTQIAWAQSANFNVNAQVLQQITVIGDRDLTFPRDPEEGVGQNEQSVLR